MLTLMLIEWTKPNPLRMGGSLLGDILLLAAVVLLGITSAWVRSER